MILSKKYIPVQVLLNAERGKQKMLESEINHNIYLGFVNYETALHFTWRYDPKIDSSIISLFYLSIH